MYLSNTNSKNSFTTYCALLYLDNVLKMFPQLEKVRAEIDQVIGSRPPIMFDKANMHYTNAFIHEVLRKANLVPLNMARTARKDTILGGYFIPKVKEEYCVYC